MDIITFDEFKKLDIRIGKILTAERVEGSNKLLKLEVDFGLVPGSPASGKIEPAEVNALVPGSPASGETVEGSERVIRQIIAGIGQFYAPEALIGKECPFAYNLAPRTLKGLESQGMILCASAPLSTDPSDASGPVLLHPDKEIPPGSIVK